VEKAKAAQKAKETRSNFLHFAATRCSMQGGAAAEKPQAASSDSHGAPSQSLLTATELPHSPTCAALSIRPARRPVAAARSESERPRWQQRGAFPVFCTAYTCGCVSVVKTNRHTAQYHRRQHRLTRSLASMLCARYHKRCGCSCSWLLSVLQ
jgi:hypothetical protein